MSSYSLTQGYWSLVMKAIKTKWNNECCPPSLILQLHPMLTKMFKYIKVIKEGKITEG